LLAGQEGEYAGLSGGEEKGEGMSPNAGVCTLFALILKAWRRSLFFLSMLKYLTSKVLEVLRVVVITGTCSSKQTALINVYDEEIQRGEMKNKRV
jgi:hypothetical protein